jgi:hypothetical protein
VISSNRYLVAAGGYERWVRRSFTDWYLTARLPLCLRDRSKGWINILICTMIRVYHSKFDCRSTNSCCGRCAEITYKGRQSCEKKSVKLQARRMDQTQSGMHSRRRQDISDVPYVYSHARNFYSISAWCVLLRENVQGQEWRNKEHCLTAGQAVQQRVMKPLSCKHGVEKTIFIKRVCNFACSPSRVCPWTENTCAQEGWGLRIR